MTYTFPVVGRNTIVVETGAEDSSTSLTLIGKNVPNYGQTLQQNLISLMQNFAGTGPINGPVEGQLWYDTTNRLLKIYNGTIFKNIVTLSFIQQPQYPGSGELWWDGTTLRIWDGTQWIAIGPLTYGGGSAAIADTIVDNNNAAHDVLALVIDGIPTAVVTKETFTAKNTYYGIVNFNYGINVTSTAAYTGGFANVSIVNASGNVNVNGTLNVNTVNASYLNGLITQSSQTNITNVGTLNGLTVSGTVSATAVNSTFNGSITGTNGSFTNVYSTSGFNGPHNGTLGSTTPNTGAFTTITASNYYGPSTGPVNGPFNGTVGATTPNTGAFTTVTATSVSATTVNGSLAGPFNGTVGATTPNTGAFTTLTASSSLGVGTTSPSYALHVNGSSSGSSILVASQNTNSGTNSQSGFTAIAAGTNNYSTLTQNADGHTTLVNNGAGTLVVGTASAQPLNFVTNNIVRMAIDSSGNATINSNPILTSAGGVNMTGGFTFTPYNIGIIGSGSYTLNPLNGNYQYYINNGAHTILAPTVDCAIDVLITNASGAGSITFSGFTASATSFGDPLDTTNGHKFVVSIRRINGTSTYVFKALQ